MSNSTQGGGSSPPAPSRRALLARASTLGMCAGLALSYGSCGAYSVRYLFPARPRRLAWQLVTRAADLAPGGALPYRTPAGETVTVTRRTAGETADDFAALSSVCPHLGCQVDWQPERERWFCPCHNGVFDPEGLALEGPPAEAGQSLSRYPLRVERGLLYIEVPVDAPIGRSAGERGSSL